MNPRLGGNYTEPNVTKTEWRGHEKVEHIAYVGGEEIGRFDTDLEAAAAVRDALHLSSLPTIPHPQSHVEQFDVA